MFCSFRDAKKLARFIFFAPQTHHACYVNTLQTTLQDCYFNANNLNLTENNCLVEGIKIFLGVTRGNFKLHLEVLETEMVSTFQADGMGNWFH